jgi:hypothetical protein
MKAVGLASTLLRLAVLLWSVAVTGCVSTKYQSAPNETPPAVKLALSAAQAPVEAVVQSVIIYGGPGSWKKEAYWDEYVVTLRNQGPEPVTIEAALLTGLAPEPQSPGTKPWALEEASRSAASRGFGVAKNVAIQVGGGVVSVVGGGLAVGLLAPALLTSGPVGLGIGAVLVVPAMIKSRFDDNAIQRRGIEYEFTRRQLVLPAKVEPGQPAEGSLFFPITPGPQRLTLRGRTGDQPVEITVDLTPLRGLHLKAGAVAPPPVSPPPSPSPP